MIHQIGLYIEKHCSLNLYGCTNLLVAQSFEIGNRQTKKFPYSRVQQHAVLGKGGKLEVYPTTKECEDEIVASHHQHPCLIEPQANWKFFPKNKKPPDRRVFSLRMI